jgi:hypothetical protein
MGSQTRTADFGPVATHSRGQPTDDRGANSLATANYHHIGATAISPARTRTMGRHQRPNSWLRWLNIFGWFREIKHQQEIAAAQAQAAVNHAHKQREEVDLLAKKAWKAMGGREQQ